MKNAHPGRKKKPQRTALDDLMSQERKEQEKGVQSSDLYSESDYGKGEESDSSGEGTRFKGRTGVFSLDFPHSPIVPKGKGKKSYGKRPCMSKEEQNILKNNAVGKFNVVKQVKFGSPNLKQRESDLTTTDSEATTVLPTQTQELTVSMVNPPHSGSDVLIQPSGFITNRRKRRRSSSTRDRERAKRHNVGGDSDKKENRMFNQ